MNYGYDSGSGFNSGFNYSTAKKQLSQHSYRWLITGVAGFIGSHLLETLLQLNQRVIGLDNLSTGRLENLDNVRAVVGESCWAKFTFFEKDICNISDCKEAVNGVDFVLHHAALGSVPRSIEDPILSNASNVDGFVNMQVAAVEAKVKRFVYAASSATYGDNPDLPKREPNIGRPLSPYAVTKYVNELYADVFSRVYGLSSIGLRYFNVFGPRQDPAGAYAAVIPCWIQQLLDGNTCHINGDGETSRDFCFVGNAVQANILAALSDKPTAINQVFNIAVGGRLSLTGLFYLLREQLTPASPEIGHAKPCYDEFREGDVRHSQADISKAHTHLGYQPSHTAEEGLVETCRWYMAQQACGHKNAGSDPPSVIELRSH